MGGQTLEKSLIEDFPSIEVSLDSEDDCSTPPVSPPKTQISREYLAAVARLHVRNERGFLRNEARTSVSSPGRTGLSLREKFYRLSRGQRQDLLVCKSSTNRAKNDVHAVESLLVCKSSVERIENSIMDVCDGRIEDSDEESLEDAFRVSRESQFASLGKPVTLANNVVINIYDLISKDTLMQLPWGCMCEIGKCFNEVNSALHELGTGAYHVGVAVNGVEFAFGATTAPGRTGIFSCVPKLSPGYQYRTSINLGDRQLTRKYWQCLDGKSRYREREEHVDGRQVIKEMIPDYMGVDYDILRKNCCTFAKDLCLRLGFTEEEIPSWFGNLAESGARTQDIAYASVEPLRLVLSTCDEGIEEVEATGIKGFEVIPRSCPSGAQEAMIVVDAHCHALSETTMFVHPMRRTASWTY